MSSSLRPHGLQHARPPCPSPTPRVYSDSCPLSQWFHPTISSSVIPFSSCLQSFPASGSFQMSQFLASGGSSIGVSASASVLFYFIIFFKFNFHFILLYNTVLVLPYIDTNPPRVYMSSQSWTPLLPPSPYHLSGSSQCTSPKHPASCIELDWWFVSYMIVYMFQCHSSKSSHPLPLPQSPKVLSKHLCLFCCLTYRVIIIIFLNSIYMC